MGNPGNIRSETTSSSRAASGDDGAPLGSASLAAR